MFLKHADFLTVISISFHCCKKVFILMNIYIDDWKKFDGSLLPEREDFYSHINIEDITDVDSASKYGLAKNICKDFEIKNWGKYHDSHVQSNTSLLADVFENFGNNKLDPAKFLSAPGLAW